MSDGWVGHFVSVECRGEAHGVYQGRVHSVDEGAHTVTLSDVFRNARPFTKPTLTIRAADIKDLHFISLASEDSAIAAEVRVPKVGPALPADVTVNKDERIPAKFNNKVSRYRSNSCSVAELYGHGKQGVPPGRRQDCFAVAVNTIDGEFDFEKNLALFNKEQVYSEIENEGCPRIDGAYNKVEKKYRHDEMVLPATAAVLRQIFIPELHAGGRDYVTDTGLVVPSVTWHARVKVLHAAQKVGLTEQRVVDMLGRSACEMVLQLIGGNHRLNPKNDHQRPKVVLFCGSHFQGAAGVNCARHLANHDVDVLLAAIPIAPGGAVFISELELFRYTKGTRLTDTRGLPTVPIDMIVNCLDCHDPDFQNRLQGTAWYQVITRWCNENKANVLAMDPPTGGSAIDTKWALGYLLPLNLSTKFGQIYLCDLGIPNKVFEEIGIKYLSPYGSKFCIPLHNT